VSLGTMAAGLSHELRNPLVSIRTLATFLSRSSDEVKLKPEFRQTVLRDVKRITGIIEGVATFAQNDRRPTAWVQIPAVLKEVTLSVAHKMMDNNISFDVEVEE